MFIKNSLLIISIITAGLIFGCKSNTTTTGPESGNNAVNKSLYLTNLEVIPKSFEQGGVSYIKAFASSSQANSLSYNWKKVGAGKIIHINPQEIIFTASVPIDTKITCTVTSSSGETDSKSIVVHAPSTGNHVPVLDSILVNPKTIAVGDTSTIQVFAHDPDAADTLRLAIGISSGFITVTGDVLGGQKAVEGADINFVATETGEAYIYLEITDGHGYGIGKTFAITITN